MLKHTSLTSSLCGWVVLAAVSLACAAGCTEDAAGIPPKLKDWKCPDYTRRYFIKVEAPGEAGNAGLHADSMFASVTLPVKIVGEGAAARPEPVLLVCEDGTTPAISVRTVAGGSETEIIFATGPGQRRFCLYTNVAKVPGEASTLTLRPIPLMVHLRGMSAGEAFAATAANPLTLKRFQAMEDAHAASLPAPRTLQNADPHPEIQPNIDDAECPFFGIQYDIFDRINAVANIINPIQYAALYEGFLRCPVAGKYKFAIDTPGVAHLVIDGVPVLAAELPDEHRDPFALNKTIDLSEGVHRVVVHYAEANPATDKSAKRTDADLQRFGIRLHWQPPFASGLLCIPPLSFVRFLPGVVTGCEAAPGTAVPFVDVETLGHIRAAAQKGDGAAREFVLVSARALAIPKSECMIVSATGMTAVVSQPGQNSVCAWVPAGTPVEFSFDSGPSSKPASGWKRVVTWPTLKTGVKEFVEREVMDLEGELLVKSAPEFLYPNETGHIHVETVLSPKPVIIHKTHYDAKDYVGWELLPPAPRPMGEFNLYFENIGTPVEAYAATPDESGRRKLRVSFPAKLDQALTGNAELVLRFVVGGVECQNEKFRLLHAHAPSWPGKLVLEGGELTFLPNATNGAATTPVESERLVVLVPHEDEASHRRLKPLDAFSVSAAATEGLFIGDPLVEGVAQAAGNVPSIGLAAALAKAKPSIKWKAIETAGPHRYRPVLRMLVDLDAFVASSPNKALPKLVVLNLGSGDVSRQTPLHTFERALDTLLARLTAGGVERVVVVGAIPEPWRERQCEPYQDRVDNVVKHHHVNGIDLFHAWTGDVDWMKRFSTDDGNSDIAGPVPNAAAIDEIVQLILSRL